MTTRSSLILNVYASELVEKDERTVAAIHGLERALPGLRLESEVTEARQLAMLLQRDEWLAKAAARREFPLVCNGDESFPVMISGLMTPAAQAPARQPLLDVQAELPLAPTVITAAANVIEAVADGVRAFWGHATPEGAALDITYQTAPTLQGPPSPRRGLPALKLFEHIRSPEIGRAHV